MLYLNIMTEVAGYVPPEAIAEGNKVQPKLEPPVSVALPKSPQEQPRQVAVSSGTKSQAETAATPVAERHFDEVGYERLANNLGRLAKEGKTLSAQEQERLLAELDAGKDVLTASLTVDDDYSSRDRFSRTMALLEYLKRESSFRPAHNFAKSFMSQHLQLIDERISNTKDIERFMYGVTSVASMLDMDAFGENKPFADFVNKHFGRWLGLGAETENKRMEAVNRIFKDCFDEQAEKMISAVLSLSRDPSEYRRPLTGRFISSLAELNIGTMRGGEKKRDKLQKAFFQQYGLDQNVLMEAWQATAKRPDQDEGRPLYEVMRLNLEAITELEYQRPGISGVLSSEFGIKDFGRYPVDLLVKQYDERDNTALPFGIILNPVSDWNGAFYHDAKLFEPLAQQLGERCAVRVIESGSKEDAVMKLLKLRRKYGRKSAFGLIGGHGTQGTINLGEGYLVIKDLTEAYLKPPVFLGRKAAGAARGNYWAQRTVRPQSIARYIFEDNAPVALQSCSTGKISGIGQRASNIGLRIYAPREATSMSTFAPVFDENEKVIDLDVEYYKKETKMEYEKGRLAA